MKRPKPDNAIDLTRLLGYEQFEFKVIDGKQQILPIEVNNYICIRPENVGFETGDEISLFMTHLANFLKKEKYPLTTKEILNILNDNLKANSSQDLKIEFQPKNSTLRNDYFFLFKDGLELNKPIKNDKYITWMYYSQVHKKWKIDFGEIHGIQKRDTLKLVDQKEQFRIAKVLPCQALLEDDRGELDRDKYYRVDFSQYKAPAAEMDLNLSLEINELNKWYGRIEKLVEQWNGFYPDAPLELINAPDKLALEIISSFFESPCVRIGKDHCADFEQIFRHVLKWEQLSRLNNPGTNLNNRDFISVDIFSNGELLISKRNQNKYWDSGYPIILNEKNQLPVQIKIQGISSKKYFIGGLILRADYSINNEILPVDEIHGEYAPVWLKNKNVGGEATDLILDVMNAEKGATEENILIKLFITNDDKLDTDFFCKGKPDIAAFKKGKVKSAAPKKEEVDLDWTVIDIPIRIVNDKGINSEEDLEEWKENWTTLLTEGNTKTSIDSPDSIELLTTVSDFLFKNLKEDARNYNEVILIGALLIEISGSNRLRDEGSHFYTRKKNQLKENLQQIIYSITLSEIKIKSTSAQNLSKTQNLLWHLEKYDFLEISTEEVLKSEDKLKELKKELKELIYQNSITKALDLLRKTLNNDTSHYNSVILQGAVFNEIENNIKIEAIRDEGYFAKKQQILKNILEIIDEVEIAEIQPENTKDIPAPELKEELKELLFNTQIEVSLTVLRESLKKNVPLFTSTMTAIAVFEENEANMRRGVIKQSDYSAKKEQIVKDALKKIDALTSDDLNENYGEDDLEDELIYTADLAEDSFTEIQLFKGKINDLVSQKNTKNAIELLISSLNADSSFVNDTILLSAQLKSIKNEKLVNHKSIQIERNRINKTLLSILDKLNASDLKPSVLENKEKNDLTERPTQKIQQQTNISQVPPNIITPNTNLQDYTPTKIHETGHFTDPRDGQRYKTVLLKDGKIWMAENLNYDPGGGSYFYNDNSENGEKYGRLYKWETAQKACPPGWHVPDDEEWWAMVNQYGDLDKHPENKEAYQALIKGGETNFSALLGGYRDEGLKNEYFGFAVLGGYWGSSAQSPEIGRYYRFYEPQGNFSQSSFKKAVGCSCRCVQH